MSGVKVVLVGDAGVGKTCLVLRLSTGAFPEENVPAVAEDYSLEREVDYEKILLNVYDTPAGDEHATTRTFFYPNTHVFVMCFSTVDPSSLDNITTKWIPEVRQSWPNAPFLLVGTKSDLRYDEKMISDVFAIHNRRPITHEDGMQAALQMGAASYFETSSIQGYGLDDVFDAAVQIYRSPQYVGPPIRTVRPMKASSCSLL